MNDGFCVELAGDQIGSLHGDLDRSSGGVVACVCLKGAASRETHLEITHRFLSEMAQA